MGRFPKLKNIKLMAQYYIVKNTIYDSKKYYLKIYLKFYTLIIKAIKNYG